MLLVLTPLGVLGGLLQAYELAGGLVFLMAALVTMMGCAVGSVVLTVRREQAEAAREEKPDAPAPDGRQ